MFLMNLEVCCITVLLVNLHMISQKEQSKPALSPMLAQRYFPLYWGEGSEEAPLKTGVCHPCSWGQGGSGYTVVLSLLGHLSWAGGTTHRF